jgi:hypothetical protein
MRNIDEEQWSQGEHEHECSMSVFPSMLVFPSMPKGEIVGYWFGQLVVIDVNPWRVRD